jgi:hypothetical protein
MSIKSVVTDNSTHGPFGVLVRAMIAKVMVMSLNPDVSENCIGKLLCIVQQIVD